MASKLSAELHLVDAEGTVAGFSRGRRGDGSPFLTSSVSLSLPLSLSLTTPKPILLGELLIRREYDGDVCGDLRATSNLIVYLIEEYKIKSIDTAQIFNIINGCTNLAPIVGAVISDSFGCFVVVAASRSLFSGAPPPNLHLFAQICLNSTFQQPQGMARFTSTATAGALRPPPCQGDPRRMQRALGGQNALLYTSVTLLCMGAGGTRFNMATMGANQFDRPADQSTFLNWYFFVMPVGAIIGSIVVVYVQDNVSWGWGFGACAATSAAGEPPTESRPGTGGGRKEVENAAQPESSTEYYHGGSGEGKLKLQAPTPGFGFLNRAATKREGEVNPDGSVAKPWSLCTVDQVEDLKAVLRILPLWSTSILLSTSIGILTVLQALSLDRHIGHRFFLPAGSLVVSTLSACAVSIALLDALLLSRLFKLLPALRRCSAWVLARRQRDRHGGGGAGAAKVRRRRTVPRPGSSAGGHLAHDRALAAAAAAGVALHYQEFPESLRSSATGMMGLVVAAGFYLSTAVVDLVRRATDWFPDNINAARLDRFYWTLAAAGVVNLGYFILCARLHEYRDSVASSTVTAAADVVSRAPTITGEGRLPWTVLHNVVFSVLSLFLV
ncbi:unnamed protein product [Spirodela intermedia]|uniref:Uncharacterized protein n=1 Tax=Spirodela intermedia TaxID=51605 RepID=A0A7I8IXH2_SPIIN|nr:unnamed protein product [Spirodela intermedia]CAA6661862.1 unnamed protein product [Spirodela intermedia]